MRPALPTAVLLVLTACSSAPEPKSRGPARPVPAPRPALTPDQPPSFTVEDGKLLVPGEVSFAAGQAAPTADSDAALRHVVAFLAAREAITLLRVEAHSDGTGDAEAEQKLTEARALAVVVRLIELGADEERLLPVGFGATKPIADPSTPAGRAQNRRIEFRPAAMRGKPIGNMPVDGGGRVAKLPKR